MINSSKYSAQSTSLTKKRITYKRAHFYFLLVRFIAQREKRKPNTITFKEGLFHNNLSLKNHHTNYGWFYNLLVLLQVIKRSGFSIEKRGDQKEKYSMKERKTVSKSEKRERKEEKQSNKG